MSVATKHRRPTGVQWRRRMLAALIERDGRCCRLCGADRLTWKNRGYSGDMYKGFFTKIERVRDLAIDHVVALADGGDNGIANLQLLCSPCHLSKTVAEKRARAVVL